MQIMKQGKNTASCSWRVEGVYKVLKYLKYENIEETIKCKPHNNLSLYFIRHYIYYVLVILEIISFCLEDWPVPRWVWITSYQSELHDISNAGSARSQSWHHDDK